MTTPVYGSVTDTLAAGFPTQVVHTIPNVNTTTQVLTYCIRDNAGNVTRGIYPSIVAACFSANNMPTTPTFDTYKNIMKTRLTGTGDDHQKYGYSFSENTTDAGCFRGILANNVTTLLANQLTPNTTTTLSDWDMDRSFIKNGTTRNNNGHYYYSYTSSTNNTLNMTTTPVGSGAKAVVVEGGNIHIKTNMDYSGTDRTFLIIARKNNAGQGGNIMIDA